MFQGKWYDEVALGERFGTSLTLTEAHLVLAAGLFGDFNPLHVDEEFSKKSMFGGRASASCRAWRETSAARSPSMRPARSWSPRSPSLHR